MSFRGLPSLLRSGRYFFHVPLGSRQLQALHYSSREKKSTSYVQHNGVNSSTMNQNSTSDDALYNLYSPEQQSAILQVLNTASENELSAIKLLRGRKSVNIIQHREKYGPFRNLHNLLKVPLFQYKTVIKVCNFILNPSEKLERKERKTQDSRSPLKLVKPEIERDRLETLDSIVSFVIGTRKIAWAHVDRNLTVRDWQQEECVRFMKGTYLPAVYLEEILPSIHRHQLQGPSLLKQLFPSLSVETADAQSQACGELPVQHPFIPSGQAREFLAAAIPTAVFLNFETIEQTFLKTPMKIFFKKLSSQK
ncbi:transcription elongation factor, mitochondrial isoform X4 [Carettochelys insculpta]|uniref:transcription elongation factor, mitochondrial isoform X4 n=1 Tax=Carettochelys insculpta TaxID=44489 RepID=UPI003EB72AAD